MRGTTLVTAVGEERGLGKKGVGSLCSCPASYTLSSGGWVQQSGSGGSFSNQSSSSSYSENGTFATTNSDGAVHGTVEGGGSSNEEGHSSSTSTFGSGSVNESSSSGHGGTHFSRSESGTRSYAITNSADRLSGSFTSDDSTGTSFQYNRSTSGSGEYVSSSTGTTGYSFSGAGDYDSYGSWGGTSGTFTAYVAYGSTTEQTTYSTPGSTNGGWDLDHTVASSSGHGNGGYTYTGSGSACMSGGGSYTPMSAAASGGFSYGYSSSDSSGSGSYSNVDNFGFTFDASYNHETHQTEEVQMVGGAWSLASSSSGSSGHNPGYFVYGQDIDDMKISNVDLDDLYDLQPGGSWRIPWWSGSQHSMSMSQQSQLSSEQSGAVSFESVESVASLGSPADSQSGGLPSAASASFASSAVPAAPAAHAFSAPAFAVDSLLGSFARPTAEEVISAVRSKLGARAVATPMSSEAVDALFTADNRLNESFHSERAAQQRAVAKLSANPTTHVASVQAFNALRDAPNADWIPYKRLTWADFETSNRIPWDAQTMPELWFGKNNLITVKAQDSADITTRFSGHDQRQQLLLQYRNDARQYITTSVHYINRNLALAPNSEGAYVRVLTGVGATVTRSYYELDPQSIDESVSAFLDPAHTEINGNYQSTLKRTLAALQRQIDECRGRIERLGAQADGERERGLTSRLASTEQRIQTAGEELTRLEGRLAAGRGNLLTHEQGHFDITELYARMLRAELRSLRVAVIYIGGQAGKAEDLAKEMLAELAQARYTELRRLANAMNRQGYDAQVNHNENPNMQLLWNGRIRAALNLGDHVVDPRRILRALTGP